jgi:Kef-type K+ transport system membrane component KefB
MIVLIRPMMKRWIRWTMHSQGDLGIGSLAILLAVLFGCAVLTGLIGIFAVFGAFMLGAVLSDEHEFRVAVSSKLRDVVTGFLLPVFFTSTGLRTNIGSLGSWTMAMWAAIVFVAAVIGKLAGCGLWARWSGFSVRESACIGAMMNTRGLMELVVVNLGYELRVIPPSVYCMLVLMAFGTTLMTTPLLRRLAPGTELETPIRESASRPAAVGGQLQPAP